MANLLTNYAGKDFTFIHPEVLDEKCVVADGKMHLQNSINREDFRILIVPSCKTISVSNLRKIHDFYEQGGTIIFTTRLPSKAVEQGKDEEVSKTISKIFPEGDAGSGIVHLSNKGGKAVFIRNPNGQTLREKLDQTIENFDVEYPVNEDIRYIHKVIDGQEVYYFANIGDTFIDIPITLSGTMNLEKWNPHNGRTETLKARNNQNTALLDLELAPFNSCFLIGERK